MSFTWSSEGGQEVELVRGGTNKPVTDHNKVEDQSSIDASTPET